MVHLLRPLIMRIPVDTLTKTLNLNTHTLHTLIQNTLTQIKKQMYKTCVIRTEIVENILKCTHNL